MDSNLMEVQLISQLSTHQVSDVVSARQISHKIDKPAARWNGK